MSASRSKAKKWICALLLAGLPTALVRPLVNALGHRIRPSARVGFSFVLADSICMDRGARVGHGNIVECNKVLLRPKAYLGHLNRCVGPMNVWLSQTAGIGNNNSITRGGKGVSYGSATLRLGVLSKITSGHKIDCTACVRFGDYTTLAGVRSQIWSHGYVHDLSGSGRYRIDGKVSLGDNVYVGSGSIITGGVSIGSGVIVGAGVTIPRSILEPGAYVSSPIRKLPRPEAPRDRPELTEVMEDDLTETVFRKS